MTFAILKASPLIVNVLQKTLALADLNIFDKSADLENRCLQNKVFYTTFSLYPKIVGVSSETICTNFLGGDAVSCLHLTLSDLLVGLI